MKALLLLLMATMAVVCALPVAESSKPMAYEQSKDVVATFRNLPIEDPLEVAESAWHGRRHHGYWGGPWGGPWGRPWGHGYGGYGPWGYGYGPQGHGYGGYGYGYGWGDYW